MLSSASNNKKSKKMEITVLKYKMKSTVYGIWKHSVKCTEHGTKKKLENTV